MAGIVERRRFFECGWALVREAFGADEAGWMRRITWDAIERQYPGVRRADPSSWTVECPAHLDHLKGRAEMASPGTPKLRDAIGSLLGSDDWRAGRGWGANFVVFPTDRPFDVAAGTWHVDAAYDLPLEPVDQVQVITLYGDVAPHAGGMQIIEGSHRVIARWALVNDLPATQARRRKALMRSHPWLASLADPGPTEERVERFMSGGATIGGVPVRVIECAGRAGDVYLIHPLVLHCRPTNAGTEPRFMLSTFATRDGAVSTTAPPGLGA